MFVYGQPLPVAIQNNSTIDWDYDLDATIQALQIHQDRDFGPIWGRKAVLEKVAPHSTIPSGRSALLIVDSADEPGAEGYHELTDDGYPIMYVGVKDTLSAGDKVPTTICHEIDEGAVDPAINAWIEVQIGGQTYEFAAEVCDAVETDEYLIGNIPMSNFQTPDWFIGFIKGEEAAYDFMKLCTQPFEIRKGGYMAIKHHGRVTQIYGSVEAKQEHKKRPRRRFTLRQKGGRFTHDKHQRDVARNNLKFFNQYVV